MKDTKHVMKVTKGRIRYCIVCTKSQDRFIQWPCPAMSRSAISVVCDGVGDLPEFGPTKVTAEQLIEQGHVEAFYAMEGANLRGHYARAAADPAWAAHREAYNAASPAGKASMAKPTPWWDNFTADDHEAAYEREAERRGEAHIAGKDMATWTNDAW